MFTPTRTSWSALVLLIAGTWLATGSLAAQSVVITETPVTGGGYARQAQQVRQAQQARGYVSPFAPARPTVQTGTPISAPQLPPSVVQRPPAVATPPRPSISTGRTGTPMVVTGATAPRSVLSYKKTSPSLSTLQPIAVRPSAEAAPTRVSTGGASLTTREKATPEAPAVVTPAQPSMQPSTVAPVPAPASPTPQLSVATPIAPVATVRQAESEYVGPSAMDLRGLVTTQNDTAMTPRPQAGYGYPRRDYGGQLVATRNQALQLGTLIAQNRAAAGGAAPAPAAPGAGAKPAKKKRKKVDADTATLNRLKKIETWRKLTWDEEKQKYRTRIRIRDKRIKKLHEKLGKLTNELERDKTREGEAPPAKQKKLEKVEKKLKRLREANTRDRNRLDRMRETERELERRKKLGIK